MYRFSSSAPQQRPSCSSPDSAAPNGAPSVWPASSAPACRRSRLSATPAGSGACRTRRASACRIICSRACFLLLAAFSGRCVSCCWPAGRLYRSIAFVCVCACVPSVFLIWFGLLLTRSGPWAAENPRAAGSREIRLLWPFAYRLACVCGALGRRAYLRLG